MVFVLEFKFILIPNVFWVMSNPLKQSGLGWTPGILKKGFLTNRPTFIFKIYLVCFTIEWVLGCFCLYGLLFTYQVSLFWIWILLCVPVFRLLDQSS